MLNQRVDLGKKLKCYTFYFTLILEFLFLKFNVNMSTKMNRQICWEENINFQAE